MANKRFIYDEYGIVIADFFNIDLANDVLSFHQLQTIPFD